MKKILFVFLILFSCSTNIKKQNYLYSISDENYFVVAVDVEKKCAFGVVECDAVALVNGIVLCHTPKDQDLQTEKPTVIFNSFEHAKNFYDSVGECKKALEVPKPDASLINA